MTARSQKYRLASGGLIDRCKRITFTFDGKTMMGHPGDTLASALVANGVKLVGRSFKYHRPRGLMTAGPEEPNALVELGKGASREPNTKATTIELYEGLEAESQNRWPNLRFDLMAVNSILAPILVAGFYYKTFMWPASFWEKLYEPLIRRAAGLGKASGVADPDNYERAWAHCDILIVGAGATGLSAALVAGRSGARVILLEEDGLIGGRLLADGGEISGDPASEWINSVKSEIERMTNVRIMTRTSAFGVYDGGIYAALEKVQGNASAPVPGSVKQRLWRICARRCIVAAGAVERPIVFSGNDLPGVMMASAVRTYIKRFAAAPGERMVLFTNNDEGWKTALVALEAGVRVEAIVDPRADLKDDYKDFARENGIDVHHGVISVAHRGRIGVNLVEVKLYSGRCIKIAADLIAISGGWNPSIGLSQHHRGKPAWRDDIMAFVPADLPPGMSMAGACNGDFGLKSGLDGGFSAAQAAILDCGFDRVAGDIPSAEPASYSLLPIVRTKGKGKAFVDFQHDVTDLDIELAHREGFESVEHLKRYTTLGMATDQGKNSNVMGLAIMADCMRKSIPEVGATIFRPPHIPIAIGALAGRNRGRHLHPKRLTPSHQWAAERGALFVDAGLWQRAQWYPQAGESDWLTTVNREVQTVRNGVGFCDVSTLGKIEVMGADAGIFLDRVYANTFSTLPVGKARYGIMLREDGIVMDDGTTSRFADDRYFMTTTTAKAGPVLQHLEFCRQVLWPELDVQLTSCTDQWAQFSIAGPLARDLLRKIVDPCEDLSNEGFPFMGVREVSLRGGLTARLFRISFSGELAFEISVPAHFGDSLARNLMMVGREFGVTPYGTEALAVMRIEKGHIAGGELNGNTTADDLGLAKMRSLKKDFIGRVMAHRAELTRSDRQVIVGVKPMDRTRRLRSGAQIVTKGSVLNQNAGEGYITSACYSPALGHWIGLALAKSGRKRMGEIVRCFDLVRGEDQEVEICHPTFYDPEGARQRG